MNKIGNALLAAIGPLATAAALSERGEAEARQAQEAALMTEAFRELEERKQQAVVSGLKGEGEALSPQGRATRMMREVAAQEDAYKLMKGAAAKLALNPIGALGGAARGIGKALTPGWKTKAIGLGVGLGAGAAGFKAIGAAKDYMMAPHQPAQQRGGLGRLKSNVNEFGY